MQNKILNLIIALILPLFAFSGNLAAEVLSMSGAYITSQKDTLSGKDSKSAVLAETGSSELLLLSPELLFFPKKISQKDLLIITRKNNETANKLKYIITAGTKTITGEFKGTKTEMKAYINLVSELKDLTGLEKITVVITDSAGLTLATTDISLVSLD